jgi:hypothetical protein
MSRWSFACLLGASLAGPAFGQQRPEPQLLLTMFGGVSSGVGLWEINRQPYARRSDATTHDTLRLVRRLESGLTLGASATIFPGPNLGFTAEIVYLGFNVDDDCTIAFLDPSVVNLGENQEVCADVTRTGASASVLAFTVGTIVRAASRSFASPYLRGQVGITTRNSSTVEMQGRFLLNNTPQARLVIDDPRGGAVYPTAAFGAGVMIPLGPGYQVRLEGRNQLLLVRQATGVADALLVPPTGTKVVHSLGLLIKLDIVLEQRRGRRY